MPNLRRSKPTTSSRSKYAPRICTASRLSDSKITRTTRTDSTFVHYVKLYCTVLYFDAQGIHKSYEDTAILMRKYRALTDELQARAPLRWLSLCPLVLY